MKLSAPIYILKQQAKALSRREKIPLHQALDRIARREGFGAWSLLAARATEDETTTVLYSQLSPGNVVLLGGRPGQGKTLLGIGLVIESMSRGIPSAFFTLEFTEADVARCFGILNRNLDSFRDKLLIDASDRISAAKHAGSHRLPSAIGSEERESKPYGSSPRWSLQNRPMVVTAKAANGDGPGQCCFTPLNRYRASPFWYASSGDRT